MASFGIYSLLVLVLMAVVSQTYAAVYAFDGEDGIMVADRLFRSRRSPHHHPGVTGPVHTFVKTDKHANFKWGVRHHVGKKYAGGR